MPAKTHTIKNSRKEANFIKNIANSSKEEQLDYLKRKAVSQIIFDEDNPFDHLIELTHYARYLREIKYTVHLDPEINASLFNSRSTSNRYRGLSYKERDQRFKSRIAHAHEHLFMHAIEIIDLSDDCKTLTYQLNLDKLKTKGDNLYANRQ